MTRIDKLKVRSPFCLVRLVFRFRSSCVGGNTRVCNLFISLHHACTHGDWVRGAIGTASKLRRLGARRDWLAMRVCDWVGSVGGDLGGYYYLEGWQTAESSQTQTERREKTEREDREDAIEGCMQRVVGGGRKELGRREFVVRSAKSEGNGKRGIEVRLACGVRYHCVSTSHEEHDAGV